MRRQALSHQGIVLHHHRSRIVVSLFTFISDHFLLLPIGASIALVWANVAAESYFRLSQALAFMVNEVGMAFFFALIGQEIVEAVMPGGALHSWRRWGLPLVGAAGGIAGAAATYLVYVAVKQESLLIQAWPVACAVDIAISYYVLKLIFPRSAVLPFVLVLGIASNIVGVIVVAVRQPLVEAQAIGTIAVLLAIGLAMLLRAWRVPTFWPYLAICGTASWWAFYWMGIHPALAFLPIVALLPHEPRRLDVLAPPPDDDATHHFEHEWNHLVQVVLFFFGLVNAGVAVRGYDTGTWALLTAALVGRPLGVLFAVGVAVFLGLHRPPRVGWRHLVVAALATSSGFTFALFFATGLLAIGPVLQQITIGAVLTSVGIAITLAVAHLLGVGRWARRRHHTQHHTQHHQWPPQVERPPSP
jgi:NhaA family Na+:H+ antiporter